MIFPYVKYCVVLYTNVICCIETLIIQCHCVYLLRSGSGIELPALSDNAESILQCKTSSGQWPGSSGQPCGTVLSLPTGAVSTVPVWLERGVPHSWRDSAQLLCMWCPHEATLA